MRRPGNENQDLQFPLLYWGHIKDDRAKGSDSPQTPESDGKSKNRRCYNNTSNRTQEENHMLARFVTKFGPKLIADPALAVEMAPVLLVIGVAAAVHDLTKK